MATEGVSSLPSYTINQTFREKRELHGSQGSDRSAGSIKRPGAPTSLTLPMADSARPPSALAREVRITEHVGPVNPSPIGLDETDTLIEEYLSPRKLRALTGQDDLEDIRYLEMKVDTTETSLGNFGSLLPNLSHLKLNNSIVSSVRDLGSSFTNLRILWMARCCLQDVDGISAMSNIKELYLAYNEVADISPLSMVDQVEVIDLEGNNIDDFAQVEYLSLCGKLKNLTLEGNPICVTPHPNATSIDYDYRGMVKKALPSVQILDDEPLLTTHGGSKAPSGFESDWNFLMELEKDGTIGSMDSLGSSEDIPVGVAGVRPTTGYRPGSALRPSSAIKRIGTANRRPSTGLRPPSAGRPSSASRPESGGSGDYDAQENASTLTQGGVVCGNVARALKSRQRRPPPSMEKSTLFMELKHKPERSYAILEEDQEDSSLRQSDDLLEELKQFKLEHAKVQKKIESSRAPQVLTIDHLSPPDDDMSDDEDSDENEAESADDERSEDAVQAPSSSVRARRYRQMFSEGGVNLSDSKLQSRSLGGSGMEPSFEDDRPFTGPAAIAPSQKFKLEPRVDKRSPKVINKDQPILRTEVTTPEKPNISRFSKTAKAAVHMPKPPHLKVRGASSVLPSKPTVPKYS